MSKNDEELTLLDRLAFEIFKHNQIRSSHYDDCAEEAYSIAETFLDYRKEMLLDRLGRKRKSA